MNKASPRNQDTFSPRNQEIMRSTVLYACLLITTLSHAQIAGVITYEDKLDMHKNLPPDREELKDMIPQFTTSKWELYVNGDESLYQPLVEEELTGSQASQQGMRMRFGRENRILYKNLALDTMVDSRDFMQKLFLITGPVTLRKWKIGKNTKIIAGYNCLEANFRQDSTITYQAWFTPQLTPSHGPGEFHGLPGMILQIDMNEGERVITATQITLDDSKSSSIIAPSKGKLVSSDEFNKIRDEKMKEMKIQHGSGQHRMIIRHN